MRRIMTAKLKSGLTIANNASAIAALVLLASHWLGGFARHEIASASAWASGLFILSFILAAILQVREWKSWMNLVPGFWTMLSPWLLGFADHGEARLAHLAVGLVVSILGTIELCRTETLHLDD
jgi:hypothetical protein